MSHLNPQQLQAMSHVEGPLLVLAGAGSGKTTVVINRIAHLIEMGVPPSDIVGVTFTNKAAGEMRHRIEKKSNVHVLIATFHSLCALILKQSIHHMGYKPNFSIYDESDSESVIRSLLQNYEIKTEKGIIKNIRHFISSAKNSLLEPSDIKTSEKVESIFLHDIYAQYQQKLREYNALDFDDLLFLTVKLLREFPQVLFHYQQKWPFLLIDEYQDTNHAQYIIAKMIVERSNNIFAVGDPDQSIYSWRGADIGNILRFQEDFPGAKVIQLEQNYRSTNNILKAANSLIKNNKRKYEKRLWSELGDGEKISLKQFDNDIEEARFVVQKIKSLLKTNTVAAKEIAIFYRTNSQSRSFEDALIKENVPYQIIGGISFYDRKEVKDLIAFLRFIFIPDDFVSFSRIINIPKRGIGNVTIKKIQDLVADRGGSLRENLEYIVAAGPKGFSGSVRDEIQDFLSMLNAAHALLEKNQIFDALKYILSVTNYDQILKADQETYEDRKENVNELLIKISEFCLLHPGASLADFLEEITLNTAQSNVEGDDHIYLMTFHNSKGLEFDTVFMVGMEEDLFPHINSRESQDQIEEERRLCYVGMTRAKKQLFMTRARYRVIWGIPKYTSISRFVKEIEPSFFYPEEKMEADSPVSENDIQVESMVYHPSFGKGMIKKKYQTSLGLTFDIYFYDLSSIKSIVAKYAKLQKI